MPIEIQELVIRAVVSADAGPSDASGAHGASQGGLSNASRGAAPALDTDAIVQECVRQVLRILARQQER